MKALGPVVFVALLSACQIDQSNVEALRSSTTATNDQFSGATIIRGPKVGEAVVGTDQLVASVRGGRATYSAFAEVVSDNWVFPDHAYILGDQKPRRIQREDSRVNCYTGVGCLTTEFITIPLSSADIDRGKRSGITISLRGSRGERILKFSPQYVQAFSSRVTGK